MADLFAGQERTHSAFSVESGGQDNLFGDLGFGNALRIGDKALAENMRQIQKRNALPTTDDEAPRQFCVEMETGTGKTYVYTKTIFELHRRFGFTKFVVVVPSVAIREGVFKPFQVTAEHFALQYDNTPCRFFIYNSAKLSDVRRFAVSTNIEIMIINIDAFKKAENVINQAQDRLGGDTAIRFIQATNPIVIIDEPQSVDNTPKAKEAIACLKDTKGDTQADDTTYNTIMRDKEWLLSFACPLRFIFSHSALKEGWDNPNVFQVCTLIEQKSAFTCRQKVGRGLRLCVNQDGEQITDRTINVLHVMANESFAEFASALQKEIEDDTGMKFGVLQLSMFAGIVYAEKREEARVVTREQAEQIVEELKTAGIIDESGALSAPVPEPENVSMPPKLEEVRDVVAAVLDSGGVTAEVLTGKAYVKVVEEEKALTPDDAQELMAHFEKKGYVTGNGKIKDTMKDALKTGTLDLPEKYEAARSRFEAVIAGAERRPPIRDASRDVVVRLNKRVMVSPEFMELWNKIRQKTTYRVQIDEKRLHDDCVKELRDMPPIPKARLVSRTADIHIENAGVRHTERSLQTTDIADTYGVLPDILTAIRDETMLNPSTLAAILIDSGRTGDFLNDPEAFLQKATAIIRERRHALAIDGIRYVRLDDQEYYAQEIFDASELLTNLDRNAVKVNRSVYDYLVYDSSTIEKPFALALDNDHDVKMFFKLPERFKIDTPIGTYNPDWAVYLTRDSQEKLYFILETKGSGSLFDLREREALKIHCGKRHFQALDSGVEMRVATDWMETKRQI